MQKFLLELGKGFLFEQRQKRFTFNDKNFYVDLVLYNRLLRCYVLIDFKIDELAHQDLGQMQMYVNNYDRYEKIEGKNPTIALCGLLTIMASNAAVGIYMTYALPMVFSIFYYDKKLTLQTSVFSYLFLVLSLFLRSQGVKQIEFDTNFTWFVSRSVGFLIENIVMALVCIKIAEGARKVLENLNNTQKVATLVEECHQASEELRVETAEFKQNIKEFRSTNAQITSAAEQTLLDCDGNE